MAVGNMTDNITSRYEEVYSTTVLQMAIEVGTLAFVSIIGTIGNLLAISAILMFRNLRTLTNGFVLNLGLADILVTMIMIPVMIPARIYHRWLPGNTMCQIHGFFTFTTISSSLMTLAAIAVNRYMIVVHRSIYKKIFTLKTTAATNVMLWIVSMLVALPPLVGWGTYQYDIVRDNCIFDRKSAPTFSFFFSTVDIIFPLVLTCLCYARVFIEVVRSRKRVRDHNNQLQQPSKDELRVTRKLFIVCITFIICWAPMNIMLITDPKGLIQREYYMVATWMLLANSAVNPIIYGAMNTKFRQAYKNILKTLLCRERPVLEFATSQGIETSIVRSRVPRSTSTRPTGFPGTSVGQNNITETPRS